MEQAKDLYGIFDSHAHYDDDAFAENREDVISRIHQNGVCGVVNIGCDLKSSQFSMMLSEKYDWFYASVGIHPGNAEEFDKDTLTELESLLNHPKVVAIGEIGLDYHYSSENKKIQKDIFYMQMELAQKKGLPVILHIREATADMFEIIRQFPANGVVHCFSGSAETAKELVKMGYYIGFTGVVTFSNAQKIKKAVLEVPLNRLLLETDAPYMAPVPFRGKPCTSDLIQYTAAEIARLKGVAVQEVINHARQNTCKLFGISESYCKNSH